jgi:cell division transport system ATP-binding protein
LVQFKNVSRIHENGVSSIKDVDFVINEGEFVFLIGPSGSGKTTIIELLIRDQRPTEGKIFFNDVDITDISRGSVYKLRRQIGVIFQDFKLIPDKTAFENVAFAMEAAGKSNKEIKETVPYVLDIVGLGHRMDAFPKQLSGGEQQRVAIARAISNNPKLLIADEPTGNLDPASAWDIVQILTKINNWGTTVIMSTHGTDIVNTLNKRVIQLEEGLVLRDDNEGQYEFSEKVSKKQIEEILIQSSDVSVEKPKSRFKLKLGKDLKVDKSEVVNERASEPGMKTENRKQKSESEPELGDVSQEAENSENRHITDNRSSITKEDKKSKKKVKLNLSMGNNEDQEIKPEEKELSSDYSDEEETSNDESPVTNHKELNTAADTKIDFLILPKKIINRLKEANYKTVREIVEDGAEVLEDLEVFSPEDLVAIAEAIDKLVNEK